MPKHADTAEEWLSALDNPRYPKNSVPASYQHVVVCSKHFDELDSLTCVVMVATEHSDTNGRIQFFFKK